MHWSRAFLAGMVGAAVMGLVGFVVRAFGFPFGFEMLLGSWVTGRADTVSWLIGLGVHFAIGGMFGVIYALLFRWLRVEGGPAGVVISVVHLMIAGFLFAAIPPLHALVPELVPAPGLYMSNHGPLGVALFVATHILFGAVTGGSYRRSTHARIPAQGGMRTYP
jgi:hypothetical protein